MTATVIIGHGKTPVGKGWGEKIDACYHVVRMWNWHWQDELDWGTRYDYGFYEIIPTEMVRFWKHNCRTPKYGWIATRASHHVKPWDGKLPQPTLAVYDPTPWELEGMRLGGVGMKGRLGLSRGVRAAIAALTTMFAGDLLVLVGFDNVYTGRTLPSQEGFPQVYIDCPAAFPMHRYDSAQQTETKSGNHDFAVEGPLLEAMAKRAGVKLLHAQDVW